MGILLTWTGGSCKNMFSFQKATMEMFLSQKVLGEIDVYPHCFTILEIFRSGITLQ